MSALAAARRDAVSSPGGGSPPACARSRAPRSGAPGSVFGSALRFASSSACAWRSARASALPAHFLFLPAAPLRLRVLEAFCSFDLARKRHRGPRESPARVHPGRMDYGVVAIPCLPNADAANDTLPRTRCARSSAALTRTSSASATPRRGRRSLRSMRAAHFASASCSVKV